MTTVSKQVIDFLAGLHSMDRLQTMVEDNRDAIIDLECAAIIEAHPEFPDADMLLVEYANGIKVKVMTHKLVDQLLVRNATAMSVTNPEGGDVKAHYAHIRDHFARKTGFEY